MPVPVKRAVFLISYELIPVLGVWDRVAGVGRWAYDNDLIRQAKPDIAASPSVGSKNYVNVETFMKLAPDVVVTWDLQDPNFVKFMEERGLSRDRHLPRLAELYEVMRLHGRLFAGKPEWSGRWEWRGSFT